MINIWIDSEAEAEAAEAEAEAAETETAETETEDMKAWKRAKNNIVRFQTEAEAWRHIAIIEKINKTAAIDIDAASAMLETYNDVMNVRYGFQAREVVFFADPDDDVCFRYRHCYDTLTEYRCQCYHLSVIGK